MPGITDIEAALTTLKTEMDQIKTGVTGLVASNQALAQQLAAAIASQDPAQLQAALDQANALVTEAQGVVTSIPPTTP